MNLQSVFKLGLLCQYIRYMEYFSPRIRGERRLLDGLTELHRFLESEEIAKGIVKEMSDWIQKLDKKYPDPAMEITKQDMSDMKEACDKWRVEILSGLDKVHVLRIELQTGLNPDELRKVADKLPSEFITSETWKKLTDIEKSDFSDAAECLLLGTATPSVMVALRGAEASIRNYYRCKTKNEPGNKTWRQLTKELKNKATDLSIEDTFIGYLDYIGDAKRNFAQHPNKIYSLREAVIIFMQVVGLVEDIYAQI